MMPQTPGVSRIWLQALRLWRCPSWAVTDKWSLKTTDPAPQCFLTEMSPFLNQKNPPPTPVFHTSFTVSVFMFIVCDEAFLGLSQVKFLGFMTLLSQQSHLMNKKTEHLSSLVLLWSVRREWKWAEWPLPVPNKFLFSHVSVVERSCCSV